MSKFLIACRLRFFFLLSVVFVVAPFASAQNTETETDADADRRQANFRSSSFPV